MAVVNKVDGLRDRQAEILSILQNVSYDKVDSYIDSHVIDLPSAKLFLKKLSKLVLYMVKEK